MIYGVILAGGNGKRLWPLSHAKRPKQLIPFINNKTLLTLTLERIDLLADHYVIITTQEYAQLTQKIPQFQSILGDK